MDRLPADGFWWLPEDTEQIPGRLEGEPGNIKLTLLGSFGDEHLQARTITEDTFRDSAVFPLVNGVIRGKEVTLVNVAKSGESFSAPGFFQFTYRPEMILFGRLVDAEENLVPQAMSIEISHLLPWYGRSGLEYEVEFVASALAQVQWSFRHPETFTWGARGYSLTLGSGIDVQRPTNGIAAQERAAFKVRATVQIPLHTWISEVVTPLLSLMRIAVWKDVAIKRIRPVFVDQLGDPLTGGLDETSCDLVLNRQSMNNGEEPFLSDEDLLFRAADLTDDILAGFIDVDSQQGQIREMFLTYEMEAMTGDDRFLSYVRLLESMHRRLFPPTKSEKAAYANRLEMMLQGLSPADQKLVAGRMKFGYEPGLVSRLHALCKPWRVMMREIHGGRQQLSEELERIAKHRNYLAHQLTDDERQYDERQVANANLLLTVIFRLNVLKDVGFDVGRAEEVVRKSTFFIRYVNRHRRP